MSRLAHATFAASGLEVERRNLDKMVRFEAAERAHAKAARPLLLIACSGAKLAGAHRALDLYQGVMFTVLRKWMPKHRRPVIFIVSALHGLVYENTVLDAYEQPMTEERQRELIAAGVDADMFRGMWFEEVFVAGGAMYRAVAEHYIEQLRRANRLAPGARVLGTSGGIGEQRGQLGEWLRSLKGS